MISIGEKYPSNNYGMMTVVDYTNARNVLARFDDTGYEVWTIASSIRDGSVKDRLAPVVYGIGFIGIGNYKASENGRMTTAYKIWHSMLQRCYSPKCQKNHPTYAVCTVSDEWHNFQNFAGWFNTQEYIGKEIDKDILVYGNKVYSPKTCVMVSGDVNKLLTTSAANRGSLPIGVTYNHEFIKPYAVQGRVEGKRGRIGSYSTPEEASAVYNKAKAAHIAEIAMEQTDNRIKLGLSIHAEVYKAGLVDLPVTTTLNKLGINPELIGATA